MTNNGSQNFKESRNGRANIQMQVRSIIVISLFSLIAAILIIRLFYLQIVKNDYYKTLVLQQTLYDYTTTAKRGVIYDRNKVELATNYATERVFISPDEMKDDNERRLVARTLSDILEVDYDEVLEKAFKEGRKDETIKKNVEKSVADRIREFMDENDINSIYFEQTYSRFYPFGSLASHVIGFCGTDGGLYGLELQYNDILTATPGRKVSARNGRYQSIEYKYSQTIDAQNGLNVVSTIDYKIQTYLEKYVEEAAKNSNAQSKVCGIVMNPNNGEVYGLAVYPYFDLNSPYTLVDYYDSSLKMAENLYGKNSTQYLEKKSELLYKTWNNKAISETYEPGSTSKIITASASLEEDVTVLDEHFYCSGAYKVPGWTQSIHCHLTTGHGDVTFVEGLQQSCNPVMMMLAERIGQDTYMKYFRAFGLSEKTGIDLPGEATSIFKNDGLSSVDLAVYSFGQRYNTTAIEQITAIAAVANGGTLVTPHVMLEIVDDYGNTIYSNNATSRRQVISEETARTVTKILADGVSGNGGAKNARVDGYVVAAKTGTSEKGTTGKVIASTVAYAPADNPEVIIILIVDEPTSKSSYGSTLAAPYVSKALSSILPYIGIEPIYDEGTNTTISSYIGLSTGSAKTRLEASNYTYQIIGDGNVIRAQYPESGSVITGKTANVYLYTSSSEEKVMGVVPNVHGLSASEAIRIMSNAGFNVKVEGAGMEGTIVQNQSHEFGENLEKGSIISLYMITTSFED